MNFLFRRINYDIFIYLVQGTGIDSVLIQPYSDHESRKSLVIYSKPSLSGIQTEYEDIIGKFPV